MLQPNWFLTHKPANPNVAYVPRNRYEPTADFDTAGDFCGLGGEHDTGTQLRALHNATRREQVKLEETFR